MPTAVGRDLGVGVAARQVARRRHRSSRTVRPGRPGRPGRAGRPLLPAQGRAGRRAEVLRLDGTVLDLLAGDLREHPVPRVGRGRGRTQGDDQGGDGDREAQPALSDVGHGGTVAPRVRRQARPRSWCSTSCGWAGSRLGRPQRRGHRGQHAELGAALEQPSHVVAQPRRPAAIDGSSAPPGSPCRGTPAPSRSASAAPTSSAPSRSRPMSKRTQAKSSALVSTASGMSSARIAGSSVGELGVGLVVAARGGAACRPGCCGPPGWPAGRRAGTAISMAASSRASAASWSPVVGQHQGVVDQRPQVGVGVAAVGPGVRSAAAWPRPGGPPSRPARPGRRARGS